MSLNKSINEKQTNTVFKSKPPVLHSFCKDTPRIIFDKSFINSQQIMQVGQGIFHYELVLRGEELKNTKDNTRKMWSTSIIKVCVKSFDYKGTEYNFFMNPVDAISRCKEKPNIVVNWKKAIYKETVLLRTELNWKEQLNKHLVKLESYIQEYFIPEIIERIESATHL